LNNKSRNIIQTQEPIAFKHAVVLSLAQEELQKSRENFIKEGFPISQCSYLSALLELKLAGLISSLSLLTFTDPSIYYSQILPAALNQLEDLVYYSLIDSLDMIYLQLDHCTLQKLMKSKTY
jgi:hypothetical protein